MFEQTPTTTQTTPKPGGKSRRGFASMDKERHKLVSSKGGKTERQQKALSYQQERTLPS